MSTTASKTPQAKPAAVASKSGGISSGLVIMILAVIAVLLFKFVLGDGSHFEGGDNNNHPHPGDFFGMVYKGGFVVPILITCFMTALVFAIERLITISKASGSGSLNAFVRKIQGFLNNNDLDSAIKECNRQQGSVGNVTSAALKKYKQLGSDTAYDKEQKSTALTKEIEEATSLEMPMLEKNLTIIATLASVATLLGLFGTVLGMIRAFAALATSGTPDASALANGISEALINTALGIGTSAICIVGYNYFTSKIDELTYSIDEVGMSISQDFAAKN